MDPEKITYDMVSDKARSIAQARGKRGTDRLEQLEMLQFLARVSKGPVQRIEVRDTAMHCSAPAACGHRLSSTDVEHRPPSSGLRRGAQAHATVLHAQRSRMHGTAARALPQRCTRARTAACMAQLHAPARTYLTVRMHAGAHAVRVDAVRPVHQPQHEHSGAGLAAIRAGDVPGASCTPAAPRSAAGACRT
jgi:hypothetical protein